MNYAWITYDFLQVSYLDVADEVLSTETWKHGDRVTVLHDIPYALVGVENKWENGCYIVQNSEGDIQAFDGQFISFENPNKKELH